MIQIERLLMIGYILLSILNVILINRSMLYYYFDNYE